MKQGKGHKTLNEKSEQIAEFVARRIDIQYIPAIRTAGAAQEIVNRLVSRELERIEDDPKYQQALVDIADLQQPILDELSSVIGQTMKQFMPEMVLKLSITPAERSYALRETAEIFLDDGVETLLQYKGDGVQSLAALAMMRHSSQPSGRKKDQIIALEEPESHLHPGVIRELHSVLTELARTNQVVLTTHNPLFTNRSSVGSNIIVKNNRAIPAKKVTDVRDVLGVRLADNLSSAEVILVVEGEDDRVALQGVLSSKSELLKKEIRTGRLSIDALGGASNLSHRIRMHKDGLCKVHAFLDDDAAGKQAYEKAKEDGLVSQLDINFSFCAGKDEAELEDLYRSEAYEEILTQYCGRSIMKGGPDKKKKWTDRLRNTLRSSGKPHDQLDIEALKRRVASSVEKMGYAAIEKGKSDPVDSLVASIENKLLDK